MASLSTFKSNIVTAANEAAGVETSAGVTVYASRSSLPASGNEAGDQAYVTGNNRLYIWNGSGWYNVALLNVAPSIQSVLDSDGGTTPFALSTEGVVTTITITAADSDGDPITYTATADSDFSGLATISQDSSVFTITPFSSDSASTASGTITFTATDGVNVASSGIQTFTLQFISGLWDETVLSIGTSSTNSLANSTFIDRSTNALTVTTSGAPIQTTFHPYLDNWSVYFDGNNTSSGSGLDFGNDSTFALGTGDFTMEFWANLSSYAGPPLDWRAAQTNGNYPLFSYNGSQFLWNVNSTVQITSSAQDTNAWHHVAVVRNSGTTTMYVNGTSEGTWSDSTNYLIGSARVGLNAFSGGVDLDGYLSNVRVVKGTAVYTSNFTPPTEKLTAISGTILLTCQGNRFKDNSTNDWTSTITNDPKVFAYNPFGQGSEYATSENKGSLFSPATSGSTSGNLSVDGSSIDFTQNWTIEFWVYHDVSPVGSNTVGTINDGGGVDGMYFLHSGGFYITTTQSSWGMAYTGGTSYIDRYAWHHIAITWDGSTYTVWIDGVSRSTYSSSSAVSFSEQTIGIGAKADNVDRFGGYISDYNITTGTAKYTSAFTPPTSPVGNTNADLYLPMDNAGIYDKTGNNTLTLAGNTVTSTAQTKFANTAIYFDGTGDYVQIPDANRFDLTGDFTIELWMYHTSTTDTGYSAIFGGNGSGSNGWNIYMIESSGNLYFYHSTFLVTATSALTVNTWHHVAVSRSGSSLKMFVDGTQVGSTATTSATLVQNSSNLGTRLGYDIGANGYFEGYIEGVQLLNGVAKYTANFTAPTQNQGRAYQAES